MSSLYFLGLHPFWAVPIALLPAGLHWWWTRSVIQPSPSAVLPERLFAISRRVSSVTAMCTLAVIVLAGWHALWVFALQFVAMTASTHRTRRALFAETWPFHRYLSWRLRFHAGMFGLWWLVGLAPIAVANASPPAQWWLAVIIVASALAWHHWSGRVLLVLLGASRLQRPDLDAHFQRVFAAARVPAPPLWRAGASGGVLANAFAMITLGQRGVLFFDSLLEHLSAEEITAILAHEVAHLEQFHRRRVLTIYVVTSLLIVMLTIGAMLINAVIPGFESWVWLVTFIGVAVGILLRARRMRGHEADADVRAVELCGDGEALIRALTRIYEINHIPRRWSARYEKYATHPSLERRILAIRTGDVAAAAASPEPTGSHRRHFGIAQRVAVLIVVIFAAPYHAIGAVIAPALLALRRPTRALMTALATALAAMAIASTNEVNTSVVRVVLMAILAAIVWLSERRSPPEQPDAAHWAWIERAGLLVPVLIGLVFAAANATDLFGLHSAVRDRAWLTAALAAVAAFYFVQSRPRTSRRAGLAIAIVATAALVVGSPWFLVHAVADPLAAEMPLFRESVVPVPTLATQSVNGIFNAVRLTPDGTHFVLTGDYTELPDYSDDTIDPQPPLRFVAGNFEGWQREIRAFDVAILDDEHLLVLDRDRDSSTLRAEDLRSGRTVWTLSVPDVHLVTVQASPDGRWRALAARDRRGFERVEGHVGEPATRSTRWTVDSRTHSYLDIPRTDGSGALVVASRFRQPAFDWVRPDLHETKRLLRVDGTSTTEIATSNLRVECPAPPIDATGSVCVSFDGRSSRFWRVDLSSGRLQPLGETPHMMWKVWQSSQQQIAGTMNGRPALALLDSRIVITLSSRDGCWAQDAGVARDVVVAACYDGNGTVVSQYRLPAGY